MSRVQATAYLWGGNYHRRRLSLKLANGMKMWKGNGNTTTLLFSLKGLEILHQERGGHVNSILVYKSGADKKKHTSVIQIYLHASEAG